MSVIELDFHEPDDTLIGTLTDDQLIECELRPALQELGAISFTVSRHLAEASAALLAKGNLVKVRIPIVDADPIALFVLKDDVSQLLSKDEQGGEHLTVTGPGGLHMLSYTRLREEVYAPGQPTRGDWDDDVSWNWRGRAYGAILARVMEEGQNQPGTPLSEITLDFDRIVDSDGVPWAIIAEDFTVPIGIDALTLANRLATAGDLYLVLTPDLVLHAYQTYGRDLTGAFAADNVRFEKGVNILTELQRKTRQSRVTHLITRDFDQVYRTFITPDTFDQAVYGFLEVSSTNDPDQVEKIALAAMAASDEGSESYIFEALPGDSPESGEYLPGPEGTDGHLWPGDAVTIHTGTGEHDLNAQSVTLSAVSIVLDIAADDSTDERAARSLRIVPEVAFGVPLPAFSETSDPASAGAPGCVCLKFCRSGGVPAQLVDTERGGFGAIPQLPFVVPADLVDSALFIKVGYALPDAWPPVSVKWTIGVTDYPATLVDHNSHGTQGGIALYQLLNPVAGSGVITSEVGARGLGVWLFEHVDQADPIAEIVLATGTSAASNVSGSATGAAVINAVHVDDDDFADDNPTAPVAGVGQTSDWSAVTESGPPGFRDMMDGGGHGDVTPTWTFAESHPWAAFVATINGTDTGDIPEPVGANGEGTAGVSMRVIGCDHVHGHSDLSDHDDEIHHAIASIDGLAAALATIPSESEIQALIDATIAGLMASDLSTRYEPHVDYTGSVVLNGIGDPVMVEVAN